MHPPKDSRSLRVLVVEDELVMAQSLAQFLRSWGHEAIVAGDAPGALSVVPTFEPEVSPHGSDRAGLRGRPAPPQRGGHRLSLPQAGRACVAPRGSLLGGKAR